jgi:DNA invertase Pin-like site-specific DNA recombinase
MMLDDTNTGRLMIAVLGGLVDAERDPIHTRTAEGRSRAQKRGQHYGPALETDRRAKGRCTAAAGRERDPCRTRSQLRRREEHDFKANGVISTYPEGARAGVTYR